MSTCFAHDYRDCANDRKFPASVETISTLLNVNQKLYSEQFPMTEGVLLYLSVRSPEEIFDSESLQFIATTVGQARPTAADSHSL